MAYNKYLHRLVVTVLAIGSLVAGAQCRAASAVIGWGRQAANTSHGKCTAIAAGALHTLALTADGAVVARGDNFYGQAVPPAGTNHSLALKSDGSLVAWGSSDLGLDITPAGNDFVAIAAGELHDFALRGWCGYLLAGDLNDDCTVNLVDMAGFTIVWGAECGLIVLNLLCDDNTIDLADLARILSGWLIDCSTNPSNPFCVHK